VLVDLDRADLSTLPGPLLGGRGLALIGAPVAAPPPIPAPPFTLAPTPLPIAVGAVTIEEVSDQSVRVGTAEIPRLWLARTLFRVALHGLRLGYVETYGGFFCDDSADLTIGVVGGPRASVPRPDAVAVLEQLYDAVAPPGYAEV
jgi:hypothetical protein